MATRQGLLAAFKQGYNEVPRYIPQSVMAVSLAAGTAKSVTPPAGSRYALFSATSNIFVNCYATATVPGDTSDGSASELNPAGYEFYTNDLPTISIISPAACVVTVAFYS